MTLGPNQQRWIEALRSGEYTQGRDYLCRNGNYCCLGVAAEMFKTPATNIEINPENGLKLFDNASALAPEYAKEALGLRSRLAHHESETEKSLSSLNDNGLSFNQIADRIEADPAGYFKEPR